MRPVVRSGDLGSLWVTFLHRGSRWLVLGARPSYRRAVRRSLALALLGFLTLTSFALMPPTPRAMAVTGAAAASSPSVTVSPDPQHDLYVGDGGLVVPASDWRGDQAGRRDTATCLDCTWRVSVLCTKAELADGRCQRIDLGCPDGTVPVRIWLLRPGADWSVVGRACQGPSAPAPAPAPVTGLGSTVHDRAEAALPPLRARAQPSGSALVRVPVLYRTGQPAGGIGGADLSVLGWL